MHTLDCRHFPERSITRLDVSIPETQDLTILATALLIRWGSLLPEEIDDPRRFRPTMLFSGPPYAGKTTLIRLLLRLLDGEIAAEPSLTHLIEQFNAHYELRRMAPDTDRSMRQEYGKLLGEVQGDPYFFRSSAWMYRELREDQRRYQLRCKTSGIGRSYRRRNGYWSHFGGDIGYGHLYKMPIRRLWRAATPGRSALYSEGSYEPNEWNSIFFPNSYRIFFVPEWNHSDKTWYNQARPTKNLEPILASYRYNQQEAEQKFRLAYGTAVTSLVNDNNAADIIYNVHYGIESTVEAIRLTFKGFIHLGRNQERRKLLASLRQFLAENRDLIVQYAWSKEIEQRTYPVGMPPQLMAEWLDGYRFASCLTHSFESDIPYPATSNEPPPIVAQPIIQPRKFMNLPRTVKKNYRRTQCINCHSSQVNQINAANHIMYQCDACGKVSSRVIEVDRKIRIILTEEGIKHISVVAVIVKDNEMLFTDRRAMPFGLAFPVGHWEYNESLEEALYREVFEETGLKVAAFNRLAEIVLPVSECRAGSDTEVWCIYEVTCVNFDQLVGNQESERLVWIPLDQLAGRIMTDPARYALCLLGYIKDPVYVQAQEERRLEYKEFKKS